MSEGSHFFEKLQTFDNDISANIRYMKKIRTGIIFSNIKLYIKLFLNEIREKLPIRLNHSMEQLPNVHAKKFGRYSEGSF